MHLAITPGLVVDAPSRAAQGAVHRVLGDLRPAAPEDGPPNVIVGSGRGVDIGADGRVAIGSDQVAHLLWAACAAAALQASRLPLHGATAAMPDGRVVTVVGGGGSGKSSALLAALGAGARLVSAEWVLVGPDGSLAPLPGRLRLRAHHLAGPSTVPGVPPSARARIRTAGVLARATTRWARISGALARRAYADVDLPAPASSTSRPDVLLMLEAAPVDAPEVSTTDVAAAAPELAGLLRDDLTALGEGGALRADAAARLDALTGPCMERLVEQRLSGPEPRVVRIRHDHPRSGRRFAEAVAEVLR